MSIKAQFRCEPERDCFAADVAKTQQTSNLKNTIILPRRLRIRLLDCRSGAALPGQAVQEVRLNGKTLAKFLALDKDWDISKHFPISGNGAQRKFGMSSVSLIKASQVVLDSLGYDCGTPSDTYGVRGKTAFLKFRVVSRDLAFNAAELQRLKMFSGHTLAAAWLPASGKKALREVRDAEGNEVEFRAPTDAESDQLIRIYNTKCYRAAQFHLATLDFYPRDDPKLADGVLDAVDSGEWTEAWKSAFEQWQKVTFGYPDSSLYGWVKREKEGRALMNAQRGLVTNASGDIFVPIPLAALAQPIDVEVGFREFAVVAEATLEEYEGDGVKLHRATPQRPNADGALGPLEARPGPTHFSVEWVEGPQQTGWDQPWSWRCGNALSHSEEQRSTFKELRTSWKFQIPAFTEEELADPEKTVDWHVLHRRTKALSMFHGDDQPELVLFALTWCQPVWDEFEDPPPRSSAVVGKNNATYLWPGVPPEDVSMHMHVVTQFYDMAGTEPYGGKGYGQYEHNQPGPTRWRGDDGHHGMDIHAREGDRLFAAHAGRMTYHQTGGPIGNLIAIQWEGPAAQWRKIGYGHLTDKVGDSPRRVRAGEIVASAGRTGNLRPASDQAGHVHLNLGATENSLHDTPDEANRVCIPRNEQTPLVLPCRCDVKHEAVALSACTFEYFSVTRKMENVVTGSAVVPQSCWAVAELACPHMPRPSPSDFEDLATDGSSKIKRRIQAQLRFLINTGEVAPTGFTVTNTANVLVLDGDWGAYPKSATVTTTSAKLRDASSSQGAVLGQAAKEDKLSITRQAGEWYQVGLPSAVRAATGQNEGWIHSSLVRVVPPSRTRRAIRAFKEQFNLLAEAPTMEALYELDRAALDKLDEVAPIIPIG